MATKKTSTGETNHRQTAVKAGLAVLAAGATYFGVDAAQDFANQMVNNPFLDNVLELAQSTLTLYVPYAMASKYMRKSGDSALIRYATQVLPIICLPAVLNDVGSFLPQGPEAQFKSVLDSHKAYISTAAALIPFIGDIRRALNKES